MLAADSAGTSKQQRELLDHSHLLIRVKKPDIKAICSPEIPNKWIVPVRRNSCQFSWLMWVVTFRVNASIIPAIWVLGANLLIVFASCSRSANQLNRVCVVFNSC